MTDKQYEILLNKFRRLADELDHDADRLRKIRTRVHIHQTFTLVSIASSLRNFDNNRIRLGESL